MFDKSYDVLNFVVQNSHLFYSACEASICSAFLIFQLDASTNCQNFFSLNNNVLLMKILLINTWLGRKGVDSYFSQGYLHVNLYNETGINWNSAL